MPKTQGKCKKHSSCLSRQPSLALVKKLQYTSNITKLFCHPKASGKVDRRSFLKIFFNVLKCFSSCLLHLYFAALTFPLISLFSHLLNKAGLIIWVPFQACLGPLALKALSIALFFSPGSKPLSALSSEEF